MLLRLLASALLFSLAACGGDKGGDTGGDTASGTNTWAVRKAHIETYTKALEAAPDYDAAVVAGQAWIDANMAAYKTNCVQLNKDAQDLTKGKDAVGHRTDLKAYTTRLHKVAGHNPAKVDMKTLKKLGLLQKQMHSFWLCDNAVKAP